MISLLPYQTKNTLKLAKRNSTTLKYVAVLFFIALFLSIYYLGVKFQINNIRVTSEKQITYAVKKDQTRVDRENAIKAETNSITSSFTTAQGKLSNASYFKLINAFSDSLPNGVIVRQLVFSNSTMKTPVQIQLLATSSETISGVKDGFARNNTIFTKASVESITSNSGENNTKYPTSAVLNLTINMEALK